MSEAYGQVELDETRVNTRPSTLIEVVPVEAQSLWDQECPIHFSTINLINVGWDSQCPSFP